jgi:hypothetical protein
MNTHRFVGKLVENQAALEAARQKRRRNAEIRAALSGGTLVLAGLLMAALYHLLAHQLWA